MGRSINTEIWKAHLYGYWSKHGGAEKIKALDNVDWNVSIISFSTRFSLTNPMNRLGSTGGTEITRAYGVRYYVGAGSVRSGREMGYISG